MVVPVAIRHILTTSASSKICCCYGKQRYRNCSSVTQCTRGQQNAASPAHRQGSGLLQGCTSFQRPHCMALRRRMRHCATEDGVVEPSTSHRGSSEKAVLTLPTLLTLARVVAIPALIAVWFGSDESAALLTSVIFLLACITDFLDGLLARKMGSSSAFGAFLDPVADKLMVSTVLILLSTRPLLAGPMAGNAWLMPTLASAIIGREIAMSALREWAASQGKEAHKAVAVSQLGKWKTTAQMTSLALLLFSSRGGPDSSLVDISATVGTPLLCVAAFLTVYSLVQYMRGLWKYLF